MGGVAVSLTDGKVKVSVATITDSKGRFVFTDLPSSDGYVFSAVRSGFSSDGIAADLWTHPEFRLRLAAGEWIQDADVTLWPLGSLTGTVVDEQGEPVVGIPVRVLSRLAIGGTSQWVPGPVGKTDDTGMYRVTGLRRGTYVVHVPNVQSVVSPSASPGLVAGWTPAMVAANPAGAPPAAGLNLGGAWLVLGRFAIPPPLENHYRAYPSQYYPSSRSLSGAVPVELGAGEEKAGVNVVLQPVPTASVAGRVIGSPNAIAGLVVRLVPAESSVEDPGSEEATAPVGPDGSFRFAGVPAGSYTLVAGDSDSELWFGFGQGEARLVTTPGRVRKSTDWIFSERGGVPVLATFETASVTGRKHVTVGVEDISDLALELRAAATISGRVVTDDGTASLNSVTVVASSRTGDPRLERRFFDSKVRDLSQTQFFVKGVSDGDYRLDASSRQMIVKSINADGDYTDRPFHAESGKDIGDVVITLTRRSASVSGVVRDRSGSLVKQSAVILYPADRNEWSGFGLSPPRIRSVIAFGHQGYQCSNLRAGEYLVVAVDLAMQEAWGDSRFLEAAAAVATPVKLSWGLPTVQDLKLQQVRVR